MALTVNKQQEGRTGVESKYRLYYNADKTALVHEGDPEAAFLACGVGDDVPEGMDVPPAPAGAEAADEGYESMTVDELKAYAEENDIDLTGVTRKADIIAAIEEAEA